ncbi:MULTISPECIES: Tfp pilus assembly protein FimT/FimU [unclassified Thioalkalivibrio]|uniref:GspH/FimT family pseudopilin n=1 Tax=unclassified Thioalkalivibrio TaxID=2621013 RepID=UPI0003701714|nr:MULTISPECIES: Tfp pilus assembly protein FimT/FimU [unclassified Thioalkalivibrio]
MRHQGLTAIELMVTIGVLAILAMLAAPAFSQMLERQRVIGATNSLLNAMHLARSEALKRNERVTLCPSSDGETCRDDGIWSDGWIWFADTGSTGKRADKDPLIGHAAPNLPNVHVSGNSPVRNYVSYVPRGTTQRTNGALQMGSFTVCGRAEEGRRVIVSSIGRPRSELRSDCQIEP